MDDKCTLAPGRDTHEALHDNATLTALRTDNIRFLPFSGATSTPMN